MHRCPCLTQTRRDLQEHQVPHAAHPRLQRGGCAWPRGLPVSLVPALQAHAKTSDTLLRPCQLCHLQPLDTARILPAAAQSQQPVPSHTTTGKSSCSSSCLCSRGTTAPATHDDDDVIGRWRPHERRQPGHASGVVV